MSVFLSERIRDVKGWIPPEDIDGLDVFRAQYCRDAENVDFENGFIRNVRKPKKISLPITLRDIIVIDNWGIISSQFYRHEIRGLTWFYMIRNSSTGELKFVVTDDTLTDGVELEIFDGNISAPTDEPIEVNYMIVDNQLKINLNVTSDYVNDDTTAIYMNLTLVYLDEIDIPGVILDRPEGWYLTPRWLGWSYFDDRVEFGDLITTDLVIDKDNYTEYYNNGVTAPGSYLVLGPSAYIGVQNIKATGGIKIIDAVGNTGQILNLKIYDQPTDQNYISASFEPFVDTEYENDWEYLFKNLTNGIAQASADNISDILIESITFKVFQSNTIVLGIAEDNQVMPIKTYPNDDTHTLGVFPTEDWQTLNVPIADWDYRVSAKTLWIYVDDGTGILKGYKANPINIDAGDPGYVNIELTVTTLYAEHPLIGAPTTLNFTYGLGFRIKPYHEETDIITLVSKGDLMYSEVTFKGREYYVRDDNKLYMSHISGSGLLQPDSFPYDLELEFGFIRSDYEFEVLKALSITPLDELMVSGEQDNLIYTVQAGQTIIYRRIKALNGIVGLSSRQSLLRDAKGTGIAKGLFWVNNEGIYWHGGGVREPERINEIKLRHYWQSEIDSNTVVTIYDAYKKEILFANDKNIIVFDLVTSEWKSYKFDTGVLQFIGILNDIPYFLGDDNFIYKIDSTNHVFFEGSFTTHDTTNYQIGKDGKPAPMSELDDKILQELYSSVTNPIAGAVIVNIYADDNLIDGSILMSTSKTFQNCWTWLLVRYKRIRIKVWLTPADIELREIGFTFSIPTQAPATSIVTKEGGFGFEFGKFYGE